MCYVVQDIPVVELGCSPIALFEMVEGGRHRQSYLLVHLRDHQPNFCPILELVGGWLLYLEARARDLLHVGGGYYLEGQQPFERFTIQFKGHQSNRNVMLYALFGKCL